MSEQKDGIGDPPQHLSPALQERWNYVRESAPAGHLTRADRIAAEMLVRLFHRMQTGGIRGKARVTGRELTILVRLLSSFAMTPADRRRVLRDQQRRRQLEESALPRVM
jgi:hypothetical protein